MPTADIQLFKLIIMKQFLMKMYSLLMAQEIFKYQNQPSYQQWKELQFMHNLQKMVFNFLLPLSIFTLILIWITYLILAQNKYSMVMELVIETVVMLAIYVIGFWIVITPCMASNKKYQLLKLLGSFYEVFFLFALLKINFQYSSLDASAWNMISFGFFLKSFSQFYSTIKSKLLTFFVIIILQIFLMSMPFDKENIIYFVFVVIYYLISVVLEEIIVIREYKTLMSFLGLIETTLDAICIVNPSTKEIIFSNKKYDALQEKFENYFEKDDLKKMNKKGRQFNLLQSLQLQLLEEDQDQLHLMLNIFENENELKLKDINFKSNKNLKNDVKIHLPADQISPRIKSSNIKQMENYFQRAKEFYTTNQDLEKKVFTSEILIQYEGLNNSEVIQKQIQKQQSKHSRFYKQDSEKQINFSGLMKGQQQKFQQFKSLDFQNSNSSIQINDSFGSDRKPQIFNHKIKLLVQQISNIEFFGESEKIQIYTIQELTSILLKTKLKKLESIKKNIMRSITHELLTYLTGAFGYLQEVILDEDLNIDEQQRNLLRQSYNCLKLQIYKIHDLIDFKDILNETFEVSIVSVNLKEQIHECIELFKDQASQKKITINCDLPRMEINVQADKQKLNQLLLNLLSNAVKFTKPNGRITITAKEATSFGHLDLESSQDKPPRQIHLLGASIFEVQVTDSGIGMTEQECGKLVKKLHYRIEESEKISKDSVGIGMGLSVCKEITKKLGPEGLNLMYVDSAKNMGSSFKFFLKEFNDDRFSIVLLSDKQLESKKSSCEISNSEVDDLKIYQIPKSFEIATSRNVNKCLLDCTCNFILVVDDEQFIQQTLSLQMRKLGYEVDTSYNGREALENIERRNECKCCSNCHLYKCIFMDVNMPILDGNETVKQIRKLEKEGIIQTRLVVVAVTGFTGSEERRNCLESGFDFVLTKPPSIEKLKEVLKSYSIKPLQKLQQ